VPTLPPGRRPAGDDEVTVRLTIVRHARAGSKRHWTGPDEERPLDEVGAAHADGLARALAPAGASRLVSSPTLRCIQTLRPLAVATDLDVETWAALGPHAGPSGLRSTLGDPAFDGAVVCTHGELLRPLLRTLRRRSKGGTAADLHGRHLLAKGAAWILTIDPDGTISGFDHVPPGG
jgi:phosphohistidine phosphatase SixA